MFYFYVPILKWKLMKDVCEKIYVLFFMYSKMKVNENLDVQNVSYYYKLLLKLLA